MNVLNQKYLFTSERLGFRDWKPKDLTEFARLNADTEVMEYLPKPLTFEETSDFLFRLKEHHSKFGFTYFATEVLETGEFIGFIGLYNQMYQSDFTPATDIGWRLKNSS